MLISFFQKTLDDIDYINITTDNAVLNEDDNSNEQCCFCLEEDGEFYNYKYKNNKFIHNCNCQPIIHYNCFKSYYNIKKCCIICLEKIDVNDIGYFKLMKKKIIKLKLNIIGLMLLIIWVDCLYLLYNLVKDDLVKNDLF